MPRLALVSTSETRTEQRVRTPAPTHAAPTVGWAVPLAALVRKDVLLELRTKQTAIGMGLFALVAMVIFQFAIGSRADEATPFAGGIIWATIALTAVLGVSRAWAAEREGRTIDALLAAPVGRGVLLTAKAVSLFLYLLALEILVVPLATLFFVEQSALSDLAIVFGICIVANLALAVLGALVASLAAFARGRELLVPALFLPAIVPVLIAAAGGTFSVLGGTDDIAELRGYSLLLGGCAVVFGLVAYATYEFVFDD